MTGFVAEPIAEDTLEPRTAVHSAVSDAMETHVLTIECGFTRGFAGMQLIGNTSEVCRDGKERARTALEVLGLHIPAKRLVVSLTPAEVKKDGSQLDLPIAVSLALLLTQRTPRIDPSRWLLAAELGLAGELRPVKGVVSCGVAAMAAGMDGVVVAVENLTEMNVLAAIKRSAGGNLRVLAFRTLKDVLAWIFEGDETSAADASAAGPMDNARRRPLPPQEAALDFDDMLLSPQLETVAVTSAAGMHSMLLRGSPGTGKSMMASRLPSLLPPLSDTDHVDVMRIHSALADRLPDRLLHGVPPFRAPHHSASAAAVLGSAETPGEMSLAHGGVLFLDELPEFRRDLLESLREPLESAEVRVARSKRKIVWKARVLLVAACNNCPCGWAGSARRECQCGSGRVVAYRQRLSGPILDRIDLHVNMPEPNDASADLFLRLALQPDESRTQRLRAQVLAAREMASRRNRAFGCEVNADLAPQHLVVASGLGQIEFARLVNGIIPRSTSSRSIIRALRVARTLADVAGSAVLRESDVRQAWSWQAESSARARGELPPYAAALS